MVSTVRVSFISMGDLVKTLYSILSLSVKILTDVREKNFSAIKCDLALTLPAISSKFGAFTENL